jgi:hypothetical protein
MLTPRHHPPVLLALLLTGAGCTSTPPKTAVEAVTSAPTALYPALPEGRWIGTITSRTIPDVDKDGEWQDVIVLENCSSQAAIRFRRDTGEYGNPIALSQFPFPKTYLLFSSSTENPDGSGWSETQAWTLVDARPKGWTISQSRSVINQQMKPNDPWFTFRRIAWGSLEHDPSWCSRR